MGEKDKGRKKMGLSADKKGLVFIRCVGIDNRGQRCSRLLGKVSGDAEIKCRKCGAVNFYNSITGQVTCSQSK